jgi:hypothetical protein
LQQPSQVHNPSTELQKEARPMTKIGMTGIIAGVLSAVVVGFAAPAQADDDHGIGYSGRDRDRGYYSGDSNSPWAGQLVPTVKVPHVDTSVRN